MYIDVNGKEHAAYQVWEKTSMGNVPVDGEYCIVIEDKTEAKTLFKSTDAVWLHVNDTDKKGVVSKRIEMLQDGKMRITFTQWETQGDHA